MNSLFMLNRRFNANGVGNQVYYTVLFFVCFFFRENKNPNLPEFKNKMKPDKAYFTETNSKPFADILLIN